MEKYKCDCTHFSCAEMDDGTIQRINLDTKEMEFVKLDLSKCPTIQAWGKDGSRFYLRPIVYGEDKIDVDMIVGRNNG